MHFEADGNRYFFFFEPFTKVYRFSKDLDREEVLIVIDARRISTKIFLTRINSIVSVIMIS